MTADAKAARVSIWHATGQAADRAAAELPEHVFPVDRLARLTEALGDIAGDVNRNDCGDLDACLVRLAGEAQAWLEARVTDHRENGAVHLTEMGREGHK